MSCTYPDCKTSKIKSRRLCLNHYLLMRKQGRLNEFPSLKKPSRDSLGKKCTFEGCKNIHYSKGFCDKHYQQLPKIKEKKSILEKKNRLHPERKKQKAEAQLRYQITDKAAIAQFRRWLRKQKKEVLLTEEQVLELRKKNCHKCGNHIPRTGICFSVIDKKLPIDIKNVVPTCGICKLIKPKESFDPIEFAKNTIRRAWKKTPMASIARQRANKAIGKYECNICKNWFSPKKIHLDHIEPVVDPLIGYIDLDTWVKRLLCDENNLQYLCKPCHTQKTNKENSERRNKKS